MQKPMYRSRSFRYICQCCGAEKREKEMDEVSIDGFLTFWRICSECVDTGKIMDFCNDPKNKQSVWVG